MEIHSQLEYPGMLNLDTHILIDALIGDVSKKEKEILFEQKWCISAIVLWELAKLNQLGRIEIEILSVDFARTLSQIVVIPIDTQISQISTELDFSSDPADELIAATSIVHKIPLLTRDKRILRSKIVPLAK